MLAGGQFVNAKGKFVHEQFLGFGLSVRTVGETRCIFQSHYEQTFQLISCPCFT